MDASTAPVVAQHAAVSAVFKTGTPVYLRRKIAGLDKIVLITCTGTSTGMLIMQWSDSATHGAPPRPGEEVTCQCLLQGVLYIAKGTVDEVTQGKQPRLRIRTGEICIAIKLRKTPRYRVSGRLRISQADPPLALSQNSFHSINVSQGGFGIELARDAWTGGDQVEFVLELLIERNGVADSELPGLQLEGAGLIRRRFDIPESHAVYLGVQFVDMAQEHKDALQFWLAAHSSYLRKA